MIDLKAKTYHDASIIIFLAIALYLVGFCFIRMQYVSHIASSGGATAFHSNRLMMRPEGALGKAVDIYKPVFLLEARHHGSNSVIINGWAAGMRSWNGLFQ